MCKLKVFLLLIGLVFLGACRVSLSGAQVGEAQTLSVAMFANNASLVQPTLSQALTEDIRNYFQTQSPLRLVSTNGDMHLEGAIKDYRVTPVAVSNTGASSNRLTITVFVRFSNKKDPTKDFETEFSRFADFSATQNLVSVEQDLISQINQQLAQDIFNKAVINW
ncbi:MAG: LptE family protein [Bacteroidia bacterium]|jgi:hypothetical protein|nr:hypothetical protein [Bacteroidia bacterium]MCC6768860.1 LptE family protein [Bacteroidia bacterium]